MQQPVHAVDLPLPKDALTDRDLLEILSSMGDAVPFEYIKDADRGEAFESGLICILRDRESWTVDLSNSSYWLPLHAIMILGRMTTERAGIALADALQMEVLCDTTLLDYLSGYWPALVRNKPDTILPAYEKLLRTRADDEYGRIVSAEVLLAAAERRGSEELDRELRKIAALANDGSETLDFRQQMASLLLEMPRIEHRKTIEALADVNPERGTLYSIIHVRMVFDHMMDQPGWGHYEDPWDFYSEDSIEGRKEQFAEEGE